MNTHLMTVEEFSRLPDSPRRHELRHGEVVQLRPPARYHSDLEDNLCDALKRRCGNHYRIRVSLASRPLPEYELWAVDVGLTTKERWKATKARDWLAGSPELAIGVLSPFHTTTCEMNDRRETLFQGGCQHFWTVDYETRSVTVSTPEGANQTYTGDDSIPLEPYAGSPLPLAEIFAEIE